MMHPALAGLIDRYQPKSSKDYENAVRESGDWTLEAPLDAEGLCERLQERFAAVNFDQAKEDIAPFLKDPRELSLWSAEFFTQWIPGLKARVTPKSDRLWTSGM